MPIRIVYIQERDEHAPTVFCDACGKIIETGAEGNIEYDAFESPTPIYFTHKGECSRRFRLGNPHLNENGRMLNWSPLQSLPLYLRNQLKIDDKQVRQTESVLREISRSIRSKSSRRRKPIRS